MKITSEQKLVVQIIFHMHAYTMSPCYHFYSKQVAGHRLKRDWNWKWAQKPTEHTTVFLRLALIFLLDRKNILALLTLTTRSESLPAVTGQKTRQTPRATALALAHPL